MRRKSGNVLVEQAYAAAVGFEKARHQAEQRRFAGAIGADQADDGTLGHAERDIADRPQAAKAD